MAWAIGFAFGRAAVTGGASVVTLVAIVTGSCRSERSCTRPTAYPAPLAVASAEPALTLDARACRNAESGVPQSAL